MMAAHVAPSLAGSPVGPRATFLLAALALAPLGCGSSGDEGPAASLSRDQLLDPQTCASCHPDHVREWSGSMHSYGGADPVFVAFNRRGQRETSGALGGFCVGCHEPVALLEGATTDGQNLADVPKRLQGITCVYCHAIDRVEGSHGNSLVLSSELGTMRGELSDPIPTSAHASAYSPLVDRDRVESASLCGSCHDLALGSGVLLERLFSEWQGSVFSNPAGGASCSQCHMEGSPAPRPIANVAGAPARRYHGHGFPGIDVALTPGFPEAESQRQAVRKALDATLQSALCVVDYLSGPAAIRVILDNVGAGHSFPSGAALNRRLWTEVVAYQGAEVVYQSGVVADGAAPTQHADADMWLLRDCVLDAAAHPVDMPWKISTFVSNVLPAQQTFDPLDVRYYQGHILQSFPRAQATQLSGMPDRVTLRVRMQPIGLDILDDLVASGDLDPAVRAAMPTFDLDLGAGPVLEWTAAQAKVSWQELGNYPVSCVTRSNLNTAAQTVAAGDVAPCSP